MQETDCIFCGPFDRRVVIEENGYQGCQCGGCGLVYDSPRPSLKDINDLYGHDQANVSAQSHIVSSFPKRLYAKLHLGIIGRYLKTGKLLEIGACAGLFSR